MISRSSSSAAVIAETVVGLSSVRSRDLDPRDRPEAADRVHHVEAIDRAHQFGIGGLHRSGRFRLAARFSTEAELISSPRRRCQPRRLRFFG